MKQTFDLPAIGLKECHFGPERFGDDIVFAAKTAGWYSRQNPICLRGEPPVCCVSRDAVWKEAGLSGTGSRASVQRFLSGGNSIRRLSH